MPTTSDTMFTVGGRRVVLSQGEVERKLSGVEPDKIQSLVVEVNGLRFPVKQAFALASGIDRADFTSHQAWHAFRKLGFRVTRTA